jgi:hypothetical protein
VQRVEPDEGLVGRCSVVVAELLEVELAEVAVDAILVAPMSVRGEILLHGLRATEAGEAETDDSIGVRNPALVVLIL